MNTILRALCTPLRWVGEKWAEADARAASGVHEAYEAMTKGRES